MSGKNYRDQFGPYIPEIEGLPPGWQVKVTQDDLLRCYFICPDTHKTSFDNPEFGELPYPWVLRVRITPEDTTEIGYYHRKTHQFTTEDPREAPAHLKMAASVTKWTSQGHDLDKLQRQQIGDDISMRDAYKMVHTLDEGAGKPGGIGGMNGGVFIVRMKNVPDRYFVEKRFLCDKTSMKYAKKEIEMLRRCKHLALSCFVSGFITNGSPAHASVYVEFCDRGSLSDLIMAYRKHKTKPKIPEGFLWHAFLGLCDALAYLQGGGRFMTARPNPPSPEWKPILHRDIKPDNVLLRGRTTYGSQKPPYCVLSDFGLACEENTDELGRQKCGTSAFWAPELLYNPFPAGKQDESRDWYYFPVVQGRLADVWALGAIIFSMAQSSEYAHIDFSKKPDDMERGEFCQGVKSRTLEPFNIDLDAYTQQLQDGILSSTQWFPSKRPDAIELIPELKKKFDIAVKLKPNMIELSKLADWAIPKHKYRADESESRTGVARSVLKGSRQKP